MRERGWTCLVVHAEQRSTPRGDHEAGRLRPLSERSVGSMPRAVVQVCRADRRHEVGVTVAVHRHRPAPPQLAPQQRQQLLEHLRPVAGRHQRACGATPARPLVRVRLCRVAIVETTSRTPCRAARPAPPSRRSGRWLRPPPPGRSSAHSLRGRAHQIRFGSCIPPPSRSVREPPRLRTAASRPLDRAARALRLGRMCRVFGCVAAEPLSIRHELLHAENPLIRQSEHHDSGWGMAVYERRTATRPTLVRFPEAAHAAGELERASELRGPDLQRARAPRDARRAHAGEHASLRHGQLHVRPQRHGDRLPAAARAGRAASPPGETDSEAIFNYLMRYFDPADVPGSLRRAMSAVVARSAFSGLNFLFSDGERLYAYQLGIFDLHWLARPGQLLVASEQPDRRALAHGRAGRAAHARPGPPRRAPRRAPAG